MKIDIIVVYEPRYVRGHAKDFVPPITGMYLAALTPAEHEVRLFHQQVDELDFQSDADVVALSFFSGFAEEAYRLAAIYKQQKKHVVAGGPHVTFAVAEALQHVDTVVVGEADAIWPQVLVDIENKCAKSVYTGQPPALSGLPMPRYDLLSRNYFIPRVIQATRGCPYRCDFCSVPSLHAGYRTRPVADIIREIKYNNFPHWWQRKVVWFWDDNLLVKRKWAKELLREMIPLKKWWLTQASIDIVEDAELLQLMKASGCIGVFLGIESFESAALHSVNKRANQIEKYRVSIERLHQHGIAVMAGVISGFDTDTPQSIVEMATHINAVGVDVPFLSILTPFRGTSLYTRLEQSNRLLQNRNYRYYNGYNVAFHPARMSPDELLTAHRSLWRAAFSKRASLKRILRAVLRLRPGAMMLSAMMNAFYGHKCAANNLPRNAAAQDEMQPSALAQHYKSISSIPT